MSLSAVFLVRSTVVACRSARSIHMVHTTCSARPGKPQRGPSPPSGQRTNREVLPGLLERKPTVANANIDGLASSGRQGSSTTLLLVAGAAFCAVTADVFGEQSLHLLQALDSSAHAWVASSSALWPDGLQKFVAAKVVSDAAIATGLAGWAAVTAAALHTRSPRLAQALAASAAAYFVGAGRVWGSDPVLVDALKQAFQRVRPSEHHHTYAFPSGHTAAATLICGTLLFVLLPLALEALEEQQPQQQPQQQKQQKQQSASARSAGGAAPLAPLSAAADWVLRRRWQLWGGAAALTATGRILADVHWVSDTLAGACLGAFLTAGVALASGIADLDGGRGQRDHSR